MKKNNRRPLFGLVAGLVLVQAGMQGGLIAPAWKKNYWSGNGLAESLSPDQMLLQLFGFREFLAGLLWVRADSFFDEGNYDAVLPIIRLCTILDPKQIDVYSTGMWHIAYNFTDEEQRSDRRYVASALALGKEGTKQNPNTYELFFETGWIWYHKIDDDYFQAVKWFQQAQERKDMLPARRNLLSNAFQKNNQVQEGLDHYWKLYEEAADHLAKDTSGEYSIFQQKETIEQNLDTMIVRMVQRGTLAEMRGDYDPKKSTYDTVPQWPVNFTASVSVVDPKVISVRGTWDVLPVGTRVRIVLRDADDPEFKLAEINWDGKNTVDLDPDRKSTFMQEQLFVKNRRFNKRIDMSKDPTMYPFARERKNYIVEFYYNPRSAPPHMQDKFGYNGEGMTDPNFMRSDVRKNYKWVPTSTEKGFTSGWKLEEAPGEQRVVYTSLNMTRDMLLRKGEWTEHMPVVSTKGFDPTKFAQATTEQLKIPVMKAAEKETPPDGN